MEQESKKEELKKEVKTIDKVKNTLYGRIRNWNEKQEEILKQIEQIEELEKKNHKNFLEGFDEELETHTQERIEETPLLLNLFNNFSQEIYRPSKIYKLANNTKIKIKEELEKELTEEQKDLIEQLQYCEDKISDDMLEQAFIYRFCYGK